MKRSLAIILFALLTVFTAAAADFVLVLDPGHGGKDSGCVGKRTNEKTLVLQIARRLGQKIESSRKDIRVVYTRTDDRFIPLQRRADIANASHGNLFLSLHINSVSESSPGREHVSGISIYTLGPDRLSRNFEVVKRENSVIELEKDYTTRYQGFDPRSAESYIIFEMSSNLNLRQSIDFATSAQRRLISSTHRVDKGVRQAGFLVLAAPNMPSVLAELDFICNPNSERYLMSDDGQQAIVNGLYDAIVQYASAYIRDNSATASGKPAGRRSKKK